MTDSVAPEVEGVVDELGEVGETPGDLLCFVLVPEGDDSVCVCVCVRVHVGMFVCICVRSRCKEIRSAEELAEREPY